MPTTLHILLIEDNPDDRRLALHTLQQALPHLQVTPIPDQHAFLQALDQGGFALVLTADRLPWSDGLTLLRTVKARSPDCPVIMLTGSANEAL
ncbi:MAG: response regulator, partial [Nitrospinota bacterium]